MPVPEDQAPPDPPHIHRVPTDLGEKEDEVLESSGGCIGTSQVLSLSELRFCITDAPTGLGLPSALLPEGGAPPARERKAAFGCHPPASPL